MILIMEWIEQEVLVIVKAYPSPSKKYGEAVCTAGITRDGKWIRLYPINYRELDPSRQYKKFQWIRLKTRKSDEKLNRPESYKVDPDSIKLLETLPSGKGWKKRNEIFQPMISLSLEDLLEKQMNDGTSLGAFKPSEVIDFEIKRESPTWGAKKEGIVNQAQLFAKRKALDKIPYSFHYKFRCNDERCTIVHNLTLIDWEIGESFRSFSRIYPTQEIALQKLHEHWFDYFFKQRESYFVVGTDSGYNKFMILTVVSPQRI